MTRIIAIINTESGSYKPGIEDKIRHVLESRQVDLEFKWCESKTEKQFEEFARSTARDERVRRYIFVGGDGSVNDGTNGLLTSGVDSKEFRVALVSTGSGNDHASALNIKNQEEAISLIGKNFFDTRFGGRWFKEVDIVGVTAGEFFRYGVNSVDAAFGAHLIDFIESTEKGKRLKEKHGGGCNSRAVFPALRSYEGKDITVCINKGQALHFKNNLLANIQNSERVGGGMRLAPGAKIDDGLLNFVIMENKGLIRTMHLLFQAKYQNKNKNKGVTHLQTVQSVDIRSETQEFDKVNIDGELYRIPKTKEISYELTGDKVSFLANLD